MWATSSCASCSRVTCPSKSDPALPILGCARRQQTDRQRGGHHGCRQERHGPDPQAVPQPHRPQACRGVRRPGPVLQHRRDTDAGAVRGPRPAGRPRPGDLPAHVDPRPRRAARRGIAAGSQCTPSPVAPQPRGLPEQVGRAPQGRERGVMDEARLLERLTASDLFLLLWDDYGWSGDIGGLAILDGTSLLDRDGHLRIEAVRRQLEPRLHLVPRFRQRLYRPRRGLGWPLWVDAPSFDLADHIRVHPLAAPGDEAQLLQACAELARRRLDPARPLWELWLLPGLPQGRVGLFVKLHHAFADGMSGVAAFGALLDLDADASIPVAPPWTPTPIPTPGQLLQDNL